MLAISFYILYRIFLLIKKRNDVKKHYEEYDLSLRRAYEYQKAEKQQGLFKCSNKKVGLLQKCGMQISLTLFFAILIFVFIFSDRRILLFQSVLNARYLDLLIHYLLLAIKTLVIWLIIILLVVLVLFLYGFIKRLYFKAMKKCEAKIVKPRRKKSD